MIDVSIKKIDNGYLVTGNSLKAIYKDVLVGSHSEHMRLYETRMDSVEKFYHNKEQAKFVVHKMVDETFDAQRQCNVLNQKERDKRKKHWAERRSAMLGEREKCEAHYALVFEEEEEEEGAKPGSTIPTKNPRRWGWW